MLREWSIKLRPGVLITTLTWLGLAGPVVGADRDPSQKRHPARVFASSRLAIDEILARPYDRDVPMGCTGDRVWASSPQGWAFRDDVHWLDLTRVRSFDLEIRDEHGLLAPANATYYPSHVHYEGTIRKEMTASASFTFALDDVENPLSPPFEPAKRWTCRSSGKRQDWYEVEFGMPRVLKGLDLFFFDDRPTGGCRPPASLEVQAFDGATKAWRLLSLHRDSTGQPKPGENRLRFDAVAAQRVRFVFHHAGSEFYTGLYGVLPIDEVPAPSAPAANPLEFVCDKFITHPDTLVSVVRIHNPTRQVQTVYVDPIVEVETTSEFWDVRSASGLISLPDGEISGREPRSLSIDGRQTLQGSPIASRFRYAVVDDPPRVLKVAGSGHGQGVPFGGFGKPLLAHSSQIYKIFGHHIQPGRTKVFKAAMELRTVTEPSTIGAVIKPATGRSLIIGSGDQDTRELVASQVDSYQSWIDANLAHFDCSDPWVRKMYYHRAYVLRKNMLDPKLGRMQWPTQSEGRWRSSWNPNVISHGAAHQVREARWLRDPRYWQGHLRTWVENEKAGGIYPSHVTAKGPSGGQYADWISSTAWEGQLVHPDDAFLSDVVEKLAANVRGWQQECDPDGDGLLAVDSHGWTGMEYQPSFFFFSGYKLSKDLDHPVPPVSLERVDLTSYNYGNALAAARIHRRLGQPAKAREFDDIAAKIAGSVLAKMWRADQQYFYSLRAEDDKVAEVKEVSGVYPFYFGLVPWGKGYESAWRSILDPGQFWTKWPVASASRECPAYSQTNWPGDGRAAGCTWNGPTWPHANSLVMSAMARTLRATRDRNIAGSPLEREHLWALFTSFTKAQYRNQDLQYPWTGECYNGETGQWKTAERDYNHSTWLDILIPDLLGLVPRDDDVLEIDPLLPPSALGFFILDGQRYHGRDVTIVWDEGAPGSPERFIDGRKGLDVYVDGQLAASSPGLSRLQIDLRRFRQSDRGLPERSPSRSP